MKIAVTGATGVIGRRVLPLLEEAGHHVTALLRPDSRRRAAIPSFCYVVEASIFDKASLIAAVSDHEAVINLATHVPKTPLGIMFRPAWFENDRIRKQGASNIAAAASAVGAKILVQESFAYAYPASEAAWIDETTALNPAAYCRSVLNAESSALAFAGESAKAIVLRFAALYGSDASQTRAMAKGVRSGWAALPGKRTSFVSSISHDDAASAVAASLDAPSGIYNVSDDCPVTHEEFIAVLGRAVAAPQPTHFLPSWTTALMGSAGRTLARSIRLRNDKLKDATGWSPRSPSIREGLPAAAIAALKNSTS